jgi:hypothetical protein
VQGRQGEREDVRGWPGVQGHPWHDHLPLHLPSWGPHRRELLRDWRAGAAQREEDWSQATQAVYEITVLEEYAKLNNLTGTITVASGISAKVGDLSLRDSVEGTYVWTHLEEECPRTLVQLYRGSIKIFSNRSSTLEGGLALMEGKAKEQVAGLELGTGTMFVLCGNSALQPTSPTQPSPPTRTTGWKWPRASSRSSRPGRT